MSRKRKKPAVGITGNETALAEIGRLEHNAQETNDANFKNLLGSSAFRYFVWDTFINETGLFAPSYVREEPNSTAYYEGRRSVGAELHKRIMRVDPDAWTLMIQEQVAAGKLKEAIEKNVIDKSAEEGTDDA